MTKITYIEFNGTEHIVDVKPGLTLMEGAVKNNTPELTRSVAAPARAPPATSMWTAPGSRRPVSATPWRNSYSTSSAT